MSLKGPLVSVIVPSYNHSKYISKCIESIIAQTYQNIQVIVIDDGSTDNSLNVLNDLNKNGNFHLVSQPNMGLAKTINKGIKNYAKGEYLIIFASDDYMQIDRIEKQVAFFQENKDLGFVFSKANIVDDANNVIGILPRTSIMECSINTLIENCYVPALSSMIKMSVFKEIGDYDEESYIEDWDMWLRIASRYQFSFHDEIVANYRMHDTNISSNYEKMILAKKRIINKWKHLENFQKGYDNILLEELAIKAVLDKPGAVALFFSNIYLFKYLSFYKSIIKLLFRREIPKV